jgi:hypothetical protein
MPTIDVFSLSTGDWISNYEKVKLFLCHEDIARNPRNWGRDEWWASPLSSYTPSALRKRAPSLHWIGGRVVSTGGTNAEEKVSCCPRRNWNLSSLVSHCWASRYTGRLLVNCCSYVCVIVVPALFGWNIRFLEISLLPLRSVCCACAGST